MIKKVENGYYVYLRPQGRDGPRFRKTLPTHAEALAYVRYINDEYSTAKPWHTHKNDDRTLKELCELWHTTHGKHLKDGDRRLTKLIALCEALGDPVARELKAPAFTRYRSKRQASPKTLNNELGYINAVYNELNRTQEIDYENPLKQIRPIKLAENELSFLTKDQIEELLNSIESSTDNPHVLLITKICLSTGCRWGEAESLHTRQIVKSRITFLDTKSKKNRTVPISEELEREILDHGDGKLFTGSITSFRRALARTSITLPKGQAAHVLRHTFASHFMMNGGDILTLQRILGHASITMTMRYAHLSPDHLTEAVKKNPLSAPAT